MTDHNLLVSVAQGLDRDPNAGEDIREAKRLLQTLLKDETFRVHTWLSPLANDLSVTPVSLDEANWITTVRSAWRIDPYLAVHLSERFASPAMYKEIRRLVTANPEDVIESPVAAQILLGHSLSSDFLFQLKVLLAQWRLIAVSTILGTCCPSYCDNLLPSIVRESPVSSAVRNAVVVKSFHSSHVLLRPTNRSGSTIRRIRIRRTIHYGSISSITTIRPSNHLEHECKCL